MLFVFPDDYTFFYKQLHFEVNVMVVDIFKVKDCLGVV